MARRWLQQLIDTDYLPAIRALDDSPAGRRQAAELNQRIRQGWHQRGSTTARQQQGLMDETRRAIKDALGLDHWVLDYIRLTLAEYTEINNHKQGRVAERNEATQQLEMPDAIVAAAVRLLDSPEWADWAAGLATLTGRRVAEILSTAQFEKRSHWSVMFTGALKRRGESVTLSFEIPTLTTADRVIEALARLRAELPEATELPPAAINKQYEQAVARACDEAFAGLVPTRAGKDGLYTHLFRAVYATIAVFWYCPPSVNDTEFKAAIQGHYAILDADTPELRRSLSASRHYADYEISDGEIARYGGKRKGIKLGVGGIEPIEPFRGAWRENMKPKASTTKQVRASFRIWKEDKLRLDQILERFNAAGTQQQERFHAFLDWFELQQNDFTLPQTDLTQTEESPGEDAIPMHTQSLSISDELEQREWDAVPTSAASEPTASTTDSKIDRLIETMTKFIDVQLALAAAPAQPPQPARTTRPKPAPANVNGATASGEVLQTTEPDEAGEAPIQKSSRSTQPRAGAQETQERINQAIDAIMAFNTAPDRKHDEKWAIGINTLKAFVKSQEAIVAAIGGKNRKGELVMGTRQAEVERHHRDIQIDPDKHNYKHRGKTSIHQVVTLLSQ
jgi:hypothetical protein